MKAIVCERVCPEMDQVYLRDRQIPLPGSGEVRVKLAAASLNPVDWKLACGVAPWLTPPRIMGLDGAGVIDAVGAGVSDWQIGDRVVWHGNLGKDGVFAEYAIAPVHVLARIPEDVSDQDAAALPCAGMTAYQALVRKAHLQAGNTVLIQGAAGAVGGFAVQIAKSFGAEVIALARASDAEKVRRLGADHVLDRRDSQLQKKVRNLTQGMGVDIMLEVANPGDARQSLDMIAYNGQLLCVDPMPNLSQVPAYTYAASIHEVALGGAYAAGHIPTQRDFAVMLSHLLSLVQRSALNSLVETTVPLEDVPRALVAMRNGEYSGKVVVAM